MTTPSALDDKGALQYRLALGAAAGTTSASNKCRGGRGTLTRTAQNLLVDLLPPPSSPHNNKASPLSSSSFVSPSEAARELRLLQIEMNKMVLTLRRIKRETQQLDDHDAQGGGDEAASSNHGTEASIFATGGGGSGRDDFKALSQHVQDLRLQVRTAQQAQACQAEYEALASLLHRRHSVPRSVLQSQIDAIDQQADVAKRELRHKQEALRVRTAQVSALIQSILDLKQSLLVSSEDGGGGEISDAAGALAAPTPSSLAESRPLGSGKVQAKKRRRTDSGGDEQPAAEAESPRATKRTDASALDEPSDMEEGEESNGNLARMDHAEDRNGNSGQEEELYGDL
jgi:hypothetical protein